MRRRFTAEDRKRFVAEVRTTAAPVSEVAARLGLNSSLAYRWMQAARESGPKFARLVASDAAPPGTITIQVGAATIRVEAGVDSELLRTVISALSATSR